MTFHSLLAVIANPGVVGMLCLLVLCVWMALHPKSDEAPKILLLILGIMAFGPLSEAIMDAESNFTPLKFDYHLFLLDKRLGLSAFSLAGSLAAWQQSVLYVIYQSLLIFMIVWYGIHLYRKPARARTFLIASVITFFVGPCLYLIVPGRGPRHAFGALFPHGDPVVSPVLVELSGWPNAIPSLHVATALLFVFFSGRSRVLRALAWAFLAGTVLATLAFEHYVIDLVVAVPFACSVTWASEGRFAKALGSLALVLAWLLAIRFATPTLVMHPVALRILAVATVGLGGFHLRGERSASSSGDRAFLHRALVAQDR